MKSAYELAMERLNKSSGPSKPLTAEQKAKLADIDSLYRSKIAEKELFLNPKIQEAKMQGDVGALESLQKQLRVDTQKLKDEMESEKEKVRAGK